MAMLIFVLMAASAVISGSLAQSRGRSGGGWALFGLMFPLVAPLALVLMPDLVEQRRLTSAAAEADHQRKLAEIRLEAAQIGATKTCPRCAETIKAAAMVCRFCGHTFDAT